MHEPFFRQLRLAVLLVMLPSLVWAASQQATGQPVDNGLPSIPIVSFLTQRFLFTGQYETKLTITEMRIDHMAVQSECPMHKRTCHLSLAYSTPIGERLGAGLFELPLLGAEHVTSAWAAASFGDYIAHFSQSTTSYNSDVRLMVTFKF